MYVNKCIYVNILECTWHCPIPEGFVLYMFYIIMYIYMYYTYKNIYIYVYIEGEVL